MTDLAPRPLSLTLDVTAVPANPAGAGRYTVELAGALAARDDLDLTLISRRRDAARWVRLGAERPGPGPRVAPVAPERRPFRLAWEQWGMPSTLARLGPAVHHGPHYTMPERTKTPVVVTVHDCTFFDHPEWHERTKVMLFRRAIRVAARRAAGLICVSETTAARLREVCRVRAPITVAPHGVDHRRFTPDEATPGADVALLGPLGIDPTRPSVLFLGTLEPRKGVGGLVRAFDRAADRHPDAVLAIAGQPGWGADQVQAALATARHPEQVRRLGYVPDEAVPALLRAATVLAYPALEEGYGLPALEALACGAPLVTTEGTAMAELAAGAALLVPPGDDRRLADALDLALAGGGAEATARRQLGLQIAAERTWAASAERHLAAYRRAAAGG